MNEWIHYTFNRMNLGFQSIYRLKALELKAIELTSIDRILIKH